MAADAKEEMYTTRSVLNPDHYLLENFQKALKEHLLNQIERMKDEVFEIETETQKKKAQIEELGVQAYEYQQKVYVQQKELETLIQNVETTRAVHEKEQSDLEENKKELKNIENKLFQTEKSNRDLLREIESVTLLNKQLSNSEKKIENHISVNKRKAEKTRLDKDKLVKEKARQDYMLYTLSEETWKQESELETLRLQFHLRENELEDLEEKIVVGNITIAALQSEYRGLMHAWQSVVVAIGNRDKGLDILQQDLTKLQEKNKTVIAEIEQAGKFVKKEMLSNESLNHVKKRIFNEIKISRADLEVQLEKKVILENQMLNLQSVLDQTEQDLKVLQDDVRQKQLALEHVVQRYDNVYKKKTNIEEEILKLVQSEITNNRFGKKVKNSMEHIKAKRIEAQIWFSELENKQSSLKAEATFHKTKNEEMTQFNNDLQEQCMHLENEFKTLKANREKFEFRYRKKEQYLGIINDKLEVMRVKKAGEVSTKIEFKISEIEKVIVEVQCSVKQLQIIWLREQNSILSISAERQDQIQNVNLLKKQFLILEQKNIRISDDIEEIRKREGKIKHNINMLSNKSMVLCNTVFKKKSKKNNIDQSNTLQQAKYEVQLKDSELLLLQIAAEIADIEEEKLTFSKELIEINREVLEWEKNYIIAKDTLTNMKEAKGFGGELSSMRLEIHKMEVIFGQLKKAQDKLLKDLEHCISRRENIYFTSEAIQIKSCSKKTDPNEKIRMHLTKKLDNIKNQIRQTKNDTSASKKKIETQEIKIQEMCKKIEHIQEQLNSTDKKILDRKADLEETKLNRELKFELLVMNQRKSLMYKQIVKKQKPYVIYKQQDLAYEFHKAKTTHGKLVKITEILKEEFPDKKTFFIRLGNLLGLVSLCMYV